jgi:amicyanin
VQLLKRIMPFFIGGLVGAVLTVALLAVVVGRNSRSAGSGEPGASSSQHSEAHADHGSSPAEAGPVVDLTKQSTIRIAIENSAYARPNIQVAKGAKVTWTNRDTVRHNVMREHAGGDGAHTAPTAAEVRNDVFAGPLLGKGESYSFTFNEIGTYPYHCAPHPSMKAVVVVTE